MRAFKTLFATILMLLTVVVCGYLLYFFHGVTYLPIWINYIVRFLCICAVVAAISLFVVYMQSLEAEAAERRKRQFRSDEHTRKTTRVR